MQKETKVVIAASLALSIAFGISECHRIESAAAQDINFHKPQSLTISQQGIFDIIASNGSFFSADIDHKFSRMSSVELEDYTPWLDEETKNYQMPNDELIDLLRNTGFEGYGLKVAWAVVQKESTRRVYAHNPNANTGDNSYGLFQINMFKDLEEARQIKYGIDDNRRLFDPATNARIAFDISNGGKDWSAWTTYEAAKTIIGQFPG